MATSSEKLVATAQTSADNAITSIQIHQPGLAEEVSGDAQRGLHQCVWKCVGARKQCSGFYVDGEIARDHGDDGIDGAREQRLRENHEADDFQDGRDDRTRLTSSCLS